MEDIKMKSTAKWICENNYFISNDKNLGIAVTDPIRPQDRYDNNCLDLILMGFAGCITSEIRKRITSASIQLKGIESEVEFEDIKGFHPSFGIHLIIRIKSDATTETLEEFLNAAVRKSFYALLFRNAGIKIRSELVCTSLAQYRGMLAG
jgi:uncharacterized OsmC-like protein